MKTMLHPLPATILLGAMALMTSGCDKEDDTYSSEDVSQSSASDVSKPVFDKDLTSTTTSNVSLRCRFKNGVDIGNNMECTVHWRKYSSKPSTTPKASNMTTHESMNIYSSTTTSTTFNKAHTGLSGGNYVYYYFECGNSKYTTTTDVTYCIVKR